MKKTKTKKPEMNLAVLEQALVGIDQRIAHYNHAIEVIDNATMEIVLLRKSVRDVLVGLTESRASTQAKIAALKGNPQ